MRKHVGWMVMMAALMSPMAAQSAKSQEAKSEAKPAAQSAAKKEAAPEPRVKVGEMAPDFKLLDQNRKEVHLADFRGKKNVVVAFFVFAFTGG